MRSWKPTRHLHPQRSPRRLLAAGTGLVAVALLAAACGSPAASGGGSSTTTTKASAGGSSSTSTSSGGGGAALVKTSKSAKFGTILVGSNGHTLYQYKPDGKDKSNCTGGCAQVWPAVTAASSSSTIASGMSGFATFNRGGGVLQVAYHGVPLYEYSGDSAAGQTNGQGIGGVWSVVKANGSTGGATTTTTSGGGGGY